MMDQSFNIFPGRIEVPICPCFYLIGNDTKFAFFQRAMWCCLYIYQHIYDFAVSWLSARHGPEDCEK